MGYKTQIGIKIGPLWEFSRPHTIIGTTITVVSIFLITIGNYSSINNSNFEILVLTLMSSLLANIYIVGINQIYDIEIDRINKPYLPLASGMLSVPNAKKIIVIASVLSVVLALFVNFWLVFVVLTGMGIGTVYSIPFTRFKARPTIAAFSIAFVRGVLGNIGLYLTFKNTLSIIIDVKPIIIFLTMFVLVFSFVIAIFKDIPDLEGDKKFNVRTFTVRMGKDVVFKASLTILLINYGFGMIAGIIISSTYWNQLLIIVFHLVLMVLFYLRSQRVDLRDRITIWKFYQAIWYFFYMEYIVLVIAIFHL